MLMEDKSVAETIAAAEQADIAVFTVGVLDERSAFARAGYFSDEELQSLAKRGIVGDVCAHLIDGKGQICGSEYEKRIIAVPMDRIQSIPVRIGIAYGEYKLQGVYAALRAGYFTAFVTNTAMAGRLLRRKHLEEKGK